MSTVNISENFYDILEQLSTVKTIEDCVSLKKYVSTRELHENEVIILSKLIGKIIPIIVNTTEVEESFKDLRITVFRNKKGIEVSQKAKNRGIEEEVMDAYKKGISETTNSCIDIMSNLMNCIKEL